MAQITYPDKNTGDTFSAAEATEIKTSVNYLYNNPLPIIGNTQTNSIKLSTNTTHNNAGLIDLYNNSNLYAINIQNTSSGVGVYVDNQNASQPGIFSSCNNSSTSAILAAVIAGEGIRINNNSSYVGLHINNYGSGIAFKISNSSLVSKTILNPLVADSSSAVAYTFDTQNTLSTTGANIAEFKNNGTEKVYIDKDGDIYSNGNKVDSIGLKKVTYTYSSADILNSTVVELIPTPGAGKFINPVSLNIVYDYNTVAYIGTSFVRIGYSSSLWGGAETSVSIDYATSWRVNNPPFSYIDSHVIANQSLKMNITSPVTTGDGEIKVTIIYTIENY